MTKKQRLAIYERDGWYCFCGKPIDSALKSPDPMSASVDHIYARVDGGTDDPANLRAAHRKCNSSKGRHTGVLKERRQKRKFGTDRNQPVPQPLRGRDGQRLT